MANTEEFTLDKLTAFSKKHWGTVKKELFEVGFLVFSTMAMNPIDRLKTLKQAKFILQNHEVEVHSSALSNTRGRLQTNQAILKNEGFRGLFRGSGAALGHTFLKIGCQAQFYASIRNYFFSDGEYNYTVEDDLTREERDTSVLFHLASFLEL